MKRLPFDLRGEPGFHKFPLRIGQDVTYRKGTLRMTVVDFDENGQVTASWPSLSGRPAELTAHHSMFVPLEDEGATVVAA